MMAQQDTQAAGSSQNRPVIFSAPQGWGKSRNAKQIADVYRCEAIVDGWSIGEQLQNGAIHFTNTQIDPKKVNAVGVLIVHKGWDRQQGCAA